MVVHRRALRGPGHCRVGRIWAASRWGLGCGSGEGDRQLSHAPSPLKGLRSSNNLWVLRFGGLGYVYLRGKFENFIILLFNKNETGENSRNNSINF